MNTNGIEKLGVACLRVDTALGEFIVEASGRGVRAVKPASVRDAAHVTKNDAASRACESASAHARAAAEALRRYAAGEHVRFDGPYDRDAPALHRAVWDRLRAIPFGETVTYGEIAKAVGQPGEARAIGAVVGANPICVLIPCHRVVGADGTLRGFAWGLDLKRRLLAHEGSGALALFAEPVR